MTFHRPFQLPSLCTGGQIQLTIQSKNFEVITMRTRWWTWAAVTRFAEIVCSMYSLGCVPFGDGIRLGGDVPNHPMCEQTARSIRVIDNQSQALRATWHPGDLQRRAGIAGVTCKF